ncbi:hypothetical protein ACFSTI_10545 [Rhizorhabdus histidinilytica]
MADDASPPSDGRGRSSRSSRPLFRSSTRLKAISSIVAPPTDAPTP